MTAPMGAAAALEQRAEDRDHFRRTPTNDRDAEWLAQRCEGRWGL